MSVKPSQVTQLQKKPIKVSLGAKFILMMICILSITMGLSAYFSYVDNKREAHKDLLKQAKANSQFLARVSQEAILSSDYITLDNYTASMSLVEDIAYGVILSVDGLPASYFLNYKNKYVEAAAEDIESRGVLNVVSQVRQSENISHATFPVIFENKKIAEIVIGVDHTRLYTLAKKDVIKQLQTNAFIILILSLFIFIIFKYNTLKPVRELIKGAERITDGNLDKEVTVKSADEIGVLANAFNIMMRRLKKSLESNDAAIDKLVFLNKTLEVRVKERTGRLELAQRIAHMGHWDIVGTSQQINASNEAYNILGLNEGEEISFKKLLAMLEKKCRRKLFDFYKKAVQQQKSFETELEFNRRDNSKRFISIIAEVEVDDHYGVVLFGVLQDVTERKESAISEHKALIEKLNAESANKAKSAFLAHMSHEIRTPLTAIIGFSESVLAGQSCEQNEQALKTILRNGKHLLAVINEILDLSKIESDKLEVEIIRTNLFNLIEDVIQLMQLQAMEKGLGFSVEYNFPIPVYIQTDPTRLKQVLLNLCSNAIKFTDKGFVKVSVAYSAFEKNIDITISDTGVGISATQLERLFKPFAQADSTTTRKYGGTGLGLYISRQLVKQLGGDIYVESLKNVGTKLLFNISTGEVQSDDIAMNEDDAMRYKEKDLTLGVVPELQGNILVAEDSEDNQNLFELFISATGASVDIAVDGIEAVEKVQRGHYDLILMDMQMPRMDGVQATKKIIKLGYTIPVVALTANVMKEDRECCYQAGCTGFLSKPVDRDEFYKVLSEHLTLKNENSCIQSHEQIDSALDDLRIKFINSLDAELSLLMKALGSKDWSAFQATAHKLKGSAASFGFPNITRQAGVLDYLVKMEDYAALPLELEALNKMCRYAEDNNINSDKSN